MSNYSTTVLSDLPIVYYRCDEQSGLIVTDSSGNGYDGVLQGVTGYNQTGAIVDDPDTALLLDKYTGTITVPYTVNPTSWTKYTVEVWIKMTGAYQHVVVTYDGTTLTRYLNGTVYTSGSGSDIVIVDQGLTFIGTPANGTVDEFALYNSVFTSAQVLWHYNVGATGRSGIMIFPTTYRRDGTFTTTYRRGS